jgi:ABC-type transport system substrate-binding protein
MIKNYLEAVGLTMHIKPVSGTLIDEHASANEIDAATHGPGDGRYMPALGLGAFGGGAIWFPWCPAWHTWHRDPKSPVAERPPDGHWIWKIFEAGDAMKQELTQEGQYQQLEKIFDVWAEELPIIGFTADWPSPIYMKKGLHGIPEGVVKEWLVGWLRITKPEAWFWDDPDTQSAKIIDV